MQSPCSPCGQEPLSQGFLKWSVEGTATQTLGHCEIWQSPSHLSTSGPWPVPLSGVLLCPPLPRVLTWSFLLRSSSELGGWWGTEPPLATLSVRGGPWRRPSCFQSQKAGTGLTHSVSLGRTREQQGAAFPAGAPAMARSTRSQFRWISLQSCFRVGQLSDGKTWLTFSLGNTCGWVSKRRRVSSCRSRASQSLLLALRKLWSNNL